MNTSSNNANPLCGCSVCTCQPCNCVTRVEAMPPACACGDECGCDGGEQGCLCE